VSAITVVRHPAESAFIRENTILPLLFSHKQFLFRYHMPRANTASPFFSNRFYFLFIHAPASAFSVINEQTFIIPFLLLMIVAGLKWQTKK